MRIAAALLTALLLPPSWAEAQVSVDLGALGPPARLPPVQAPRERVAPVPVPRQAAPDLHAVKVPAAKPRPRAADTNPAQATAPAAPPLAAPPPAASPALVAAPALAASSRAAPRPMPAPVRLVFAAGKSDLTSPEEAAIRTLAKAIPTPEASSVSVLAYAAGSPDDPSTARRLSLSRGLAVRTVLIDAGIPSGQIYVRALGATAPDGPADRVELSVARVGVTTR